MTNDIERSVATRLEDVVFAIPRALYRRIVIAEQTKAAIAEARRTDLRAIRDALIEAQKITTIQTSHDPAWTVARQACVQASGLAGAGPDDDLRSAVNAFRDVFDRIARSWTKTNREDFDELSRAFDAATARVGFLLKRP